MARSRPAIDCAATTAPSLSRGPSPHDHRREAANQDHLRHAPQRQRGAPRAVRAGRAGGARRGSAPTTRTTSTGAGWTARPGTFEVRSPIDRDLLIGTFAKGDRADVQNAIAAARRAAPGWRRTPWQERLAILRRAAEFISERQMRYGADMAFEVGKNRLEALGEVEEAADLIRYYAQTVEDNDFYDHPMDNLGDAAVHTRSILRPHGVFAVISPFNFPMALVGRARSARRSWPATPWSTSPRRPRRCRA